MPAFFAHAQAGTSGADLLTTADLAALTRAPEATVRYWRHIGYGPKGFRIGRRVVYRRAEVEAWIAQLSGDELPKGAARQSERPWEGHPQAIQPSTGRGRA